MKVRSNIVIKLQRGVCLNARNWRYCVLSDLGMWLKFYFKFGNDGNSYVFGVVYKNNPIQIKEFTAYYLCLLMQGKDWELDAVDVADDRNTGSHSTQKFVVNLGWGGVGTRKGVGHRSRRKSCHHQSDAYAYIDDDLLTRR